MPPEEAVVGAAPAETTTPKAVLPHHLQHQPSATFLSSADNSAMGEDDSDGPSPGVPNGNAAASTTTAGGLMTSSAGGFHLRWTRIHKRVEVKPEVHGLLAAARQTTSRSMSFRKHPDASASASTMSLGQPPSQPFATKHNGNGHPPFHGDDVKTILHEVSGQAVPGQVLAAMGPSGSGKTSLMNVLSGRATYQEGTISVNGHPLSKSNLKRLMKKIAYVKQADIFFGHLTVRDQFAYTARLRLNEPPDVIRQEVDRILRLLRLHKVSDSPIMMLSGGERKRVNIGTELLTDPQLILLDEPTSGLDSTSAVSLLRLLRTLARDHMKTIITSIHQPSSSMFRSFDRLLMLSDGHVVYFGSPEESLEYLERRQLPCPPGYNAADHWMDLLVTDSAVDEERLENQQQQQSREEEEEGPSETGLRQRGTSSSSRLGTHKAADADKAAAQPVLPRILLQNAWDNEAVAEQLEAAVSGGGHADDASSVHSDGRKAASAAEPPAGVGPGGGSGKYVTSWWTQYRVLVHRALKNSRSAIFTPLNLCKSVAIGLVAGLLWFQTSYTESNVFDIRSYYFFTMTYWVFDSMFNALMAFPAERTVILKERASGSYRLSAYFLAKTTADAPVRLILPFLYMVVSFWMAGFDSRFSVFIGTIACTLLSVVAGEAMGLFVGAAVYDMETALTVMTVFTLALMLLGGFFVENIPIFLIWAKYLSPFKYAFDSSLQIVFDRDVPCDGSGDLGDLCADPSDTVTVAELTQFLNIQGSITFNVMMLVVFCLLPRYMAYVALRYKRGGERE